MHSVSPDLSHARSSTILSPGYLERGSIEEPNDLARNVFPSCLFVIHNSGRGGENNISELTGGEELNDPFFEVTELNIVARRDDTTFVQSGSDDIRVEF